MLPGITLSYFREDAVPFSQNGDRAWKLCELFSWQEFKKAIGSRNGGLVQVEDGIDVAKSQTRQIASQSQATLFRARKQVITAIYLGKDTRMIRK